MMKSILAATLAAALSGCVTPGDLEELKSQNKEILSKLDSLQKGGAPRPAPRAQPGQPDPSATYAVELGEAAVKGPKEAWVTVVEISDFQCPFCQRVGPTLQEIEKRYGDKVRMSFKHNPLPFHSRAKPAARAAECAKEQGKFWPMHDLLFANQRALEDANLTTYAGQAGLDVEGWRGCYTANKYDAKIDADQRQAQQLGARGTPAFFINGRFLSGAQPLERFTQLIDEELRKAQASGVPAAEYYAKEVIGKGRKAL